MSEPLVDPTSTLVPPSPRPIDPPTREVEASPRPAAPPHSLVRPGPAQRQPRFPPRSRVFGGYARGPDAANSPGLGLDIRQKPLHARGPREFTHDSKDQLKAKEKVMTNMVGYFQKLENEYTKQLACAKQEQEDLRGYEEIGLRFSPAEPHGLQIGMQPVSNEMAAQTGSEGQNDSTNVVEASPNASKIKSSANGLSNKDRVLAVGSQSQAEQKGVQTGWIVQQVAGQDYTAEILAETQAGTEDYTVKFFRPVESEVSNDRLKSTFGGYESKPKLDAKKDKCDESGEDDEDEDGEDDDEEDENAEDDVGANDGNKEHVDGAEDEDEGEKSEEDEKDDDEGEKSEDDEMDDDDDEDDAEDSDAEDKAASPSDVNLHAEDKVAAADNAEPPLNKEEAAPPEADSPGEKPEASEPVEPAIAECMAPKEAKDGQEGDGADPDVGKSNNLKGKKTKKKGKTDDPGKSADETAPTPVTPNRRSLKPAKGKPKVEEEGVSCMQTLDMGLAIRSAICVGKDVWCADWKGSVSIRSRDDASSVKAEIPTNRYIWCMTCIEPGLIWMGQESQGISLFPTSKRECQGVLTGGHTGGVNCLAIEEALGDEENGLFPTRRAWSGSNDFTIRQWLIETWLKKGKTPPKIKDNGKYTIVAVGKFNVGITAGTAMHGHTNGVRVLMKLGPQLWSGSDDGTIRIWSCSDNECLQVIQDAHKGSVLRMVVVRSYVWTAGSDGVIKEWQFGDSPKCVRQIAPPGYDRGVYSLVPLGRDVWSCGHHPDIKVIGQTEMDVYEELEAHNPYTSNLLAIDRVETKVVWSTSIADRKLRVWKHTIRGNVPSADELRAANSLYEKESQTVGQKTQALVDELAELDAELDAAGKEYNRQLDDLVNDFAAEQAAHQETEEQRQFWEDEMAGLRRLFAEAGLEHLLQDPEALKSFLNIKNMFDEHGLGHLLEDPEALAKLLSVGRILKELGLEDLLDNPADFRTFAKRAKEISEILEALGLGTCLRDPSQLKAMLEAFQALKRVLEDYGFGEAVRDVNVLSEILSRYNMLKSAFEEFGHLDLFEDPYSFKCFLKNLGKIRDEFGAVGLEYLLDSPPAMRDFLAKNQAGQDDLKELQSLKDKVALLESSLDKANNDLAATKTELHTVKTELDQYKELAPTLDELKKMKEESGQFRTLQKLKKQQDKEYEEMQRLLEEKEAERQEALEREREMSLKYKELDIFKLDVIARELKALDKELTLVGRSAKDLSTDAGKLRNHDEKEQILPYGDKVLGQCKDLRAHIRDVIHKCLSDTQRMHIGVAIDDHLAAGELEHGGVMVGVVCEEVEIERIDYGNSRAAKLRQADEMSKDLKANGGLLPVITNAGRAKTPLSGRRTPVSGRGTPGSDE